MSTTATSPASSPRKFTGWHALAMIVLFFTVMFTANGTLVYFALTTFGGTEVASSYQAGRAFNGDVANARAQDARGWKVDANAARDANGHVRVEVRPHDVDGKVIVGLDLRALLARPVDKREDVPVALAETEVGAYVGTAEKVPAGNWDLVIEARQGDTTVFRSRNRLFLKD
jgi:nitrogen fixation protein FixH